MSSQTLAPEQEAVQPRQHLPSLRGEQYGSLLGKTSDWKSLTSATQPSPLTMGLGLGTPRQYHLSVHPMRCG